MIGSQIFSNKYLKYNDKKGGIISGFTIDPGAKMINTDPKLLSQYSNMRFGYNIVLRNYIFALKSAKASANELIEIIRKNYPDVQK